MLTLRAVGNCIIEVGDTRITPESGVLFALLLYLTSNAGRPTPRSELVRLLWPESDLGSASHRLRQALYQLRKLGAPVETAHGALVVDQSAVNADYNDPCARWREFLEPSFTKRCLEFLPDYTPAFSVAFAEWVDWERERVGGLLRRSVATALAEQRTLGDHGKVVRVARLCLEVDPLNRDATIALAEAYAILGNKAGAIAVLDEHCSELSYEAPEVCAQLRALRRRILAVERSSVFEKAPFRLIGRAELIDEISRWATGSQDWSPRVMTFSGEAGIGKTRLLNEGTRRAILRGAHCIEYRPSANGAERPLAGVVDLLSNLLPLPGAVGCSPESFSLVSALARGEHADTIPQDVTDSAFRYATLRRSVLDLIGAVLTESELVIVLDDAHRLDRQSLEILLDSARANRNRFGLLIAFRPLGSTADFLAAQPDIRLVRVPRLDVDSSRTVIEQHLSPTVVSQRSKLIDWAVDLANGNPFFLVELASHCRGDNPGESLPQSLQVALQRKLDALSPTARLIAQACSVLGQNSTMGRLEAVLALPPHVTATGLSELDACGLIGMTEGRVACRHDLIAEEVARGLGASVSAYLHRRTALALDNEIKTTPVASLAWDCALHWEAAGEPEHALSLAEGIADQLLALGLPRAAADICLRAERYCKTAAQHASVLLRLSHARRILHDWNGVVEALTRRARLLSGNPGPSSDQYSEDDIALFEARWWGDFDGRVLRPALERVIDPRAPASHRLKMAVIALIVADNLQRSQAARLIARRVERIAAVAPQDEVEKERARLVYHASFGDLDRAVSSAQRVLGAERLKGVSAALIQALRWSSMPLKFTNRVADATAALEEAFLIAQRLELHSQMYHAALCIADMAVESEDHTLAERWVPICSELAMAQPVDASQTVVMALLKAQVAWMKTDIDLCAKEISILRGNSDPVLRTKLRESVIALEVLVQVAYGAAPEEGLVRRLERLHLRTRWSGTRDIEVGALIVGLTRRNKVQRARDLYARYVTDLRRSRLPMHSSLRSAGAVLETTPNPID